MLKNELKTRMKDQCPNVLVGVAPVDDLSPKEIAAVQRVHGIMARYTPLYSEDSPVFQPRDFLDNARSMVVLGVNFFFGRPELPGRPPRGEIMNFYINPECLTYIAEKTALATGFLAEHGYTAVSVATGISVKSLAARSGIGTYGKNGIILTPELGSWLGIVLIVTDAPLEPDTPMSDLCGACTLCMKACPTGALDTPYTCDIEKCLTLHLVNNKGALPYGMREKAGATIAQCNICLDACPKNKNLTIQTEMDNPKELAYPDIAGLVNMPPERYQELYGEKFFDFVFMGRKYLQRNAAVALGNYSDPQYIPVLTRALASDPEELVRGHAAWALGRIGTAEARQMLEKSRSDSSASVQAEIKRALESL